MDPWRGGPRGSDKGLRPHRGFWQWSETTRGSGKGLRPHRGFWQWSEATQGSDNGPRQHGVLARVWDHTGGSEKGPRPHRGFWQGSKRPHKVLTRVWDHTGGPGRDLRDHTGDSDRGLRPHMGFWQGWDHTGGSDMGLRPHWRFQQRSETTKGVLTRVWETTWGSVKGLRHHTMGSVKGLRPPRIGIWQGGNMGGISNKSISTWGVRILTRVSVHGGEDSDSQYLFSVPSPPPWCPCVPPWGSTLTDALFVHHIIVYLYKVHMYTNSHSITHISCAYIRGAFLSFQARTLFSSMWTTKTKIAG